MLVLDEKKIKEMDVSEALEYVKGRQRQFLSPSGNHYRILWSLASQMRNAKLVELGARCGQGAIALALGHPSNRVESWDLTDKKWGKDGFNPDGLPNIKLTLGDATSLKAEYFDDASLILLDIDPHDGYKEEVILKNIQESKFRGVLIIDDVDNPKLFKYMHWMWRRLMQVKPAELIEFGHGTFSRKIYGPAGTGLVTYGEPVRIVYETGKVVTLE